MNFSFGGNNSKKIKVLYVIGKKKNFCIYKVKKNCNEDC